MSEADVVLLELGSIDWLLTHHVAIRMTEGIPLDVKISIACEPRHVWPKVRWYTGSPASFSS